MDPCVHTLSGGFSCLSVQVIQFLPHRLQGSKLAWKPLNLVSGICLWFPTYNCPSIHTQEVSYSLTKTLESGRQYMYNSTLIQVLKLKIGFQTLLHSLLWLLWYQAVWNQLNSSWDEIKKEAVCMKRQITMSLRSREVGMLQCALRKSLFAFVKYPHLPTTKLLLLECSIIISLLLKNYIVTITSYVFIFEIFGEGRGKTQKNKC